MIEGGYYIKARTIQESNISLAPPHVREIWDWFLMKANHADFVHVRRGMLFTSIKEIQEGLKWYVGYRKEVYTKSKCEMALNWLRKNSMIETTKTTRGMVISICKYDYYQNPKNYETNSEKSTKTTRKEQPSDTIYKNAKEEKEINTNTWRENYEVYKQELESAYNNLINDSAFISHQEEFNTNVDIKLSLKKAVMNYWATVEGWKKKKASRSKEIDWKHTLTNAISMNKVYKPADKASKTYEKPYTNVTDQYPRIV